jgi:predicted GNAT superfamily acetyltransferase
MNGVRSFMMKKIQVIRNFNDANILLEKGYRILYITQDKNPKYLLFHFQNNEELQKDLQEITLSRK